MTAASTEETLRRQVLALLDAFESDTYGNERFPAEYRALCALVGFTSRGNAGAAPKENVCVRNNPADPCAPGTVRFGARHLCVRCGFEMLSDVLDEIAQVACYDPAQETHLVDAVRRAVSSATAPEASDGE